MSKEIYLKSVTVEELSKIEILDWLEGYGQVMSLAERDYIRQYGFLLRSLQAEIKSMGEVLRDGGIFNTWERIDKLQEENEIQDLIIKRLEANAENTIREIERSVDKIKADYRG